MEIKQHWQHDKSGALVMNSGNVVVDYLNKKRLIESVKEINQLFKPDAFGVAKILELMGVKEEFIETVVKEKLMIVDGDQFALDPKVTAKDTGIMTGDEPVLTGITLSRLPKNGIQHITQKLIDRVVQNGFMTLTQGKVIFHTTEGDVVFKIIRIPGIYCCFTNEKFGSQVEARRHIGTNFNGKESPCKNNPAGYRQDNFFTCELVTEGEG